MKRLVGFGGGEEREEVPEIGFIVIEASDVKGI